MDCSMSSYYEKLLATGEVKCIDEEVPFEIPQGWEWCRMGCIGDWGAGATPAKGNPDYYGGSILWLRTGELNNGIVYDSEIKITDKALQECSLRMNKIGDVLIAMYGATIGKVAIVGKELTTNQACCACTPFGIYNYYLFFFLMGSQIDFIKKGEGGAQPNISREKLISHLMPIPPLAEQYRIVEKIQYLLPLVEKYSNSQILQNKLNSEIKDKLRKSILQEAIQGKLVPQIAEEGTAQDLLEQIKTEKQKLVKEGKLKKTALNDSVIFRGDDNKYYEQIGKKCLDITEQIPFDLPSSWNWVRGKTVFMPMESIKPSSDFVYIDVDAVNNRKNIIEKPKMVKKENAPSRATRKLHKNDLLFSMVRPYLKNIALVDDKYKNAIASTGFYVITPSLGYYPMFLFHLMLSNYVVEGLNSFMKGDNSPSINNCHIKDYLYPLPPIEEQKRIVNKIDQLFKQLR
ncbi:restriction endonuclease subunit S [Bacteroides finegoldii]|uniref:restriction endonuclease subunit S n=1 Tax=Bacteroides finegoldii TaxID=338188 RepID=UPI00189F26FF|nr:restriction endonuclease subunit S [Bacteroides finegoldii]